MIRKLNFSNRNAGRQPQANLFLRLWRQTRRKRVAYARAQVADTVKMLSRQIARFEALAVTYDVPVHPMAALPAIPELPGRAWVEFRQGIGELTPAVKPAPAVVGQPETA